MPIPRPVTNLAETKLPFIHSQKFCFRLGEGLIQGREDCFNISLGKLVCLPICAGFYHGARRTRQIRNSHRRSSYGSVTRRMGLFRNNRAVVAVALLACAGCQSQPPSKNEPTSSTAVAPKSEPPKSSAVSTNTPEEKPKTFGFTVTSIFVETCCSDTPGKPRPTGQFSVEGLTPDNVRFMLSCTDYADPPNLSSTTILKTARDRWYDAHTASIEHKDYGDLMTISNFDGKPPDYWKAFATCTIDGRLDRAQNEFPILVFSSTAGDWKNGSGYEVRANSNKETLTLRCIQDVQAPCVSVETATYRAIRDGSELRLCDQDLTVISTYQIVSERMLAR